MIKDSIGNRMKENYEDRQRHYLTRRTPVIIRVDGVAFHTLTRGFDRPFDGDFCTAMLYAADHVLRSMQGFKIGYVQSDEASFLLTDYDKLTTEAWFDYNVAKLQSVTASLMTAHFNAALRGLKPGKDWTATFDARAFNIPEAEITNYFLWRRMDWRRNSLSMYARSFLSHKQLYKKNQADVHEMLHAIGENWSDLSMSRKNGTLFYYHADDSCLYSDSHAYSTFDELNAVVTSAMAVGAGDD